MPNLGMGELVLILLIVMMVFGASRLPQIGEGIGKAIKNFKRGISSDDDIRVSESKPKQISGQSSAAPLEQTEAQDADVVERKS